ncbi:MAG: glycosyltransferase family 2 protein [Thermoanaerobaculia bacterium]
MISAVVVSYCSAPLTTRAIAALREDAARAGEPLEAVAVVNSQDPDEVRAVAAVADVTIDPGRNLGYAGGLNQGIAAARGGVLFLMNPDVTVFPGAVAAITTCIRTRPLVLAGPATFLDPEGTLLIPPFEEPGPLDLARRRLALEPATATRVFARRLRRALRAAAVLGRGETLPVSAIPGALMAVSRRTLETVGPFDEGYRLYYEENDWQRRLRRAGGTIVTVGAARAIHTYGRSTAREPSVPRWFAESEKRYFATHFGARGAAALEALAAAPAGAWPALPVARSLAWEGPALGVALSPLRSFAVFAWTPLSPESRTFTPPQGLHTLLTEAPWYARTVVDASGRTVAEVTLRV